MTLHCENISFTDLAGQFGTPLYVYSQSALTEAFCAYTSAFSALSLQHRKSTHTGDGGADDVDAGQLAPADRVGQFDVEISVEGSGLSGQAGAIRHGLSKALTYYEPGLRPVLKPHGFLTRDSRVVERKKYGKAKARRSFQFSKR